MGLEVIVGLVGTLVGTGLSIYVPIFLSYRKYNRAPKVTGEWQTIYQTSDFRLFTELRPEGIPDGHPISSEGRFLT